MNETNNLNKAFILNNGYIVVLKKCQIHNPCTRCYFYNNLTQACLDKRQKLFAGTKQKFIPEPLDVKVSVPRCELDAVFVLFSKEGI